MHKEYIANHALRVSGGEMEYDDQELSSRTLTGALHWHLQEGFVHCSTFGIASQGSGSAGSRPGSGTTGNRVGRGKGGVPRVPLVSENKVRRQQ